MKTIVIRLFNVLVSISLSSIQSSAVEPDSVGVTQAIEKAHILVLVWNKFGQRVFPKAPLFVRSQSGLQLSTWPALLRLNPGIYTPGSIIHIHGKLQGGIIHPIHHHIAVV